MKRLERVARWVLGVALIAAAGAGVWAWWRWHYEDRVYVFGYEHAPPNQVEVPGQEPTGFIVELTREAARRRGIRVRWEKHRNSSERAVAEGRVDVWPLLTITPERQKLMYFSEPYQEREFAFLVRVESGWRRAEELTEQRVVTNGVMVFTRLLESHFPRLRREVAPTLASAVQGLCEGRYEVVFAERYPLHALLEEEALCAGVKVRVLPTLNLHPMTAVASTWAARAVADALREEIGRMTEDGTVDRIALPWSATSQALVSLDRLQKAHRATLVYRWMVAGMALLALLALWAALGYRRAHEEAEQTGQELKARERELRLLTSSLGEMVVAYGTDRRLLFANPGAERLTGVSRAVLGQLEPGIWAAEGERAGVLRAWGRAFGGQETGPLVYPIARPDGGQRWVSARLGPIRDEKGRQIGAQSVEADITERREAEQRSAQLQEELRQSQKLESIGRLAGGVAHDFNNLITVIRGYGQLLEAEAEGPAAGMVSQIIQASDRAAELTSQLLAIGRRQPVEPRLVDVTKVVRETTAILQRMVGEDIEVRSRLAEDLPEILAAPGQLHQILLNLAANARDAIAGQGSLLVETSLKRVERAGLHAGQEPGDYVQITVTDSGKGMDEVTLSRVFEPFFTTKAEGCGTGLGLSIVYGIVKQAGGAIWVYSEPGKGTSFKIQFPAQRSGLELPAAREERARGGRERILVVEDQEMVRTLACGILEGLGYTVLSAGSAEEALAAAGACEEAIELLLTDVIMPGRNGRELAEELAQTRPAMGILFMSGYSEQVVEHRGVLKPGVNYLAKPFSPQELGRAVRRVLDGRR